MKNKTISLLITIFLTLSIHLHAKENNWKPAQEGDKIIMIRHALAPGRGDPKGFKIDDCTTQRNLDEVGINQSKNIGKLFKEKQIKIDQVLSSQWCRCKDTAKYAFKNFETFDALNSFYDEKFAENETKQIKNLKNYIKNWNSDKNLVLITHFVVISSILNTGSSSGEIIISDKNFNIIGSIDMM